MGEAAGADPQCRIRLLVAERNRKMAASAHAYVRGHVAEFLAGVVGRGHARQLDHTGRASWLAELQRNRSKSRDAPSWLWNSVVDLVATHEAAYLQHCRRYVLAAA